MDRKSAQAKRPSSVDVARLAGVSRATVSAYINGTRYVSPELGQKIERAITELNYTPDPLARALKMKDAKTIGLVIPVMSRFYTPIMQAVNEIAHQNQYGFLLCSSEEDPAREREVLDIFQAKRISGILLVPCSLDNLDFLRSITSRGTPIVQINRKITGLDTDSIISDNFNAAHTATKHLIEKGRRHLVLLGFDRRTLSANQKKSGFEAALSDAGLTDAAIIPVKDHDRADIARAFREFLDSNFPMDGLICSTQGKTSVALDILKERGISIPDDVSVIGFDDTPWSALLFPPLTVVSENTHRMGESAATLLMERMEGAKTGPPENIVLEDDFIIRAST
ncbi:MAG: LacI family DNA-binding transcriptional regulator [Deltaproteobacteria bacterium]|nr:LacI family DNA-binding transcriptional regulator [Candidatus Zymogenaceae bacterium]